jgi:hypothetical protein
MALNARSKSIDIYQYTFKELDEHFAINFYQLIKFFFAPFVYFSIQITISRGLLIDF